jgi:ABC-type antimicrobial peptide transport system permease subunit
MVLSILIMALCGKQMCNSHGGGVCSLLAFALAFVVALPIGVIEAITNQVLTPTNISAISSPSLSFPLDINISKLSVSCVAATGGI